MQAKAVDSAQVPVIFTDHLIHLKIPAADFLILRARKQVWVAWGDDETDLFFTYKIMFIIR
jgi:hypothetical protein